MHEENEILKIYHKFNSFENPIIFFRYVGGTIGQWAHDTIHTGCGHRT